MSPAKVFIFGILIVAGCTKQTAKEEIYSAKVKDPVCGERPFACMPLDTLYTETKYSSEQQIVLGHLTVNKEIYRVKSIFKKISVADGYRGQSLLLFEGSEENIFYTLEDGDWSQPQGIRNNKLVLKAKDGSICFEAIDSFPTELVLGCDVGLLLHLTE